MTIKQHGGIFGRNPTFNNVEVDGEATLSSAKITDLTNNRIVVVGTGGEIEDDANLSWDGSQFNVSNGTVTLFVTQGTDANAMRVGVGGNVSAVLEHRGFAGQNFLIQDETVASITAAGNLAFTSGRGIDFSATAGTGTSELFSDYEQGAWTPAYDSTNSDLTATIGSSTNCVYTKIGNIVYIEGFVGVTGGTVTAGTGSVLITGLPYAATAPGGISIVRNNDWGADNHPVSGYINTGDSHIQLKKLPADPRDEIIDCDASLVLNGGNDNGIYFFGHYRTS